MKEDSKQTDHLQDTQESLGKIREELDLSEAELEQLGEGKIRHLNEMIEKIENGIVEIAVFGEVSSGKSALLNAMLGYDAFEVGARNGVTVIQDKKEWEGLSSEAEIKGFADSKVVLVDSPGINEVAGEERTKIAYETIRTSDIILFVVKGDLTETEYNALKELHHANKPIIVAINKVDNYTEKERQDILKSIKQKLDGTVKPEDIVETAGNPKPVTVIVQKADGSEERQLRKVKPKINSLRERIFAVLPEWKQIVALNSSLFASNLNDQLTALKIANRERLATMETHKYAVIKGAAAALNPIPVVDMMVAMPIDYLMVKSISEIYGIDFSFKENQNLIGKIVWSNAWKVGGVEFATFGASTAAKFFTLGVSQVFFAIPQGLVAAWTSYIIGKSTDVYFAQNCSWGKGGAKAVVQDIIDNTDKKSVISELKVGVIKLLQDKESLKKELKKAKETAKEFNDTESESLFGNIQDNIGDISNYFKNIFSSK